MDLFITNLDRGIEEEDLKEIFQSYGDVLSVVLVRDKETRRSKGYGFINMFNAMDAQRAIDDLNGREVAGRSLIVKEARSQEEKESYQPRESRQRQTSYNSYNESDSDYISVKFDKETPKEEDLPMKVQDEAEFSKTVLEDGYISISFKN